MFKVYKVPLLISATVAVIILAVKVLRSPFDIALTASGAVLGTFVLDFEYVLYAYLFEPDTSFSKTLRGYVTDKDFNNLLRHVYFNRNEVKDKTLNSAFFQILIGMAAVFVAVASTNLFVKAFVLSIFANSIYKLLECYFEDKLDDWFWIFKSKPTKPGAIMFAFGMLGVFGYCVYTL